MHSVILKGVCHLPKRILNIDIKIYCLIIVSCLVITGCQKMTKYTYKGNFSVQLPTEPTVKSAHPDGVIVTCEQNGVDIKVTSRVYPIDIIDSEGVIDWNVQLMKALTEVHDGCFIKSQRAVTLKGCQGQELEERIWLKKTGYQDMIFKVIVAKNKVYVLIATWTPDNTKQAKQARKIIESFVPDLQ